MIEIIKFKSGELIIADCSDTGANMIVVDNPVSVLIDQYYEGDSLYETYEFRPWIPLTDTKSMLIDLDDVLIKTECNKLAVDKYNQYINKPVTIQPSKHLH